MKKLNHLPGGAWTYTSSEIESAKNNNRLLNCDIEITRRCNLNCIFCYSASGKALSQEMSVDEMKNVIMDAKELGAKTITLTGGEPTICSFFFELAEFINENQMIPQIFSNGISINDRLASKMVQFNVHPCISLESTNAAIHDEMVGVQGAQKKTLRGIECLINAGYTDKIPLTINAVITKKNFMSLAELWQWADSRNIAPFFLRLIPKGRSTEHSKLGVYGNDLKSLIEEISTLKGYSPDIPYFGDGGCRKHYMSCYVNSEGFVRPCSCLNINCGNIKHKKLSSILKESPIVHAMRNIDDHIVGKCSHCEDKSRCYGCRAISYALTGNMVESDPTCWR